MNRAVSPNHKQRVTGRIVFAMIVVVGLVAAFIVRLVDIQVVSAATLTEEATDRRAYTSVVYGTRGDITDRNGNILADSVERYDITTSPRVALGYTDLNGAVLPALEQLGAVVGSTATELYAILNANPESDYAVLARDLTLDEYLAVRELAIPWLYAVRVPARTYPNGAVAGNLIGFLGTDEPLAGIERTEDQCLAGQDGLVSYESSADGVRLPGTEVVETAAVDGGDVQLTIDRDLQWYLEETLAREVTSKKATWGAAVVVDITTGEILALADNPTLDPNDFQSADPGVTGSRAFAIPYEPGSIMKPITMAMLLDQGKLNPYEAVYSPYTMSFGTAGRIDDFGWHIPNLTAAGVLAVSSNTGTSQLATRLDNATRLQYLHDFGFGSKTEVDFNGESAGILATQWDDRTNLNISFGHGIATTILQMASAYQTIANDGVRLPLQLVKSCTQADGTVVETDAGEARQVISAAAANTTLRMLETVHSYYSDLIDVALPGYRMGIKSGTAYVAEGGVYVEKTVLSFAGIAPVDDPKYAVVISVQTPYMGFSSSVGPTLRDIMSTVLTLNQVQPSTGKANPYPITY